MSLSTLMTALQKTRDKGGFTAFKPFQKRGEVDEENQFAGLRPDAMFGGDEEDAPVEFFADNTAGLGYDSQGNQKPVANAPQNIIPQEQANDNWWQNLGLPKADTETPNLPAMEYGKMEREVAPLEQLSLDGQIATRERDAAMLRNEPIQKQKWWKDLLFKGATIGSNIWQGMKPNGGQQLAVEGWGKAQRNRQVGDNNQALGQLYGMRGQQNQQRELDTNNALRQTQIADINSRPQREVEKAQRDLQNKITLEATKYQNRLSVIERQADIKSGEAKIFVDGEGKVWKQYLKPDANGKLRENEPVVNPTTGEQETDPSKQFYDIYDPTTGQTVKANGGQILGYSGAIQQGNAQRTQQVNIQNSNQEFEAQKLNVQNTVNYNKQVVDQMRELAKSKGQIIENEGEINGISSEMETVQQQMNSVDTSTEEGAKRYNDLALKYGALNNKLETAIGKTTAGTEAVAQLASQNIKRPGQIKAVKVQPTIIKPRTVPKEKDPLGLFQ